MRELRRKIRVGRMIDRRDPLFMFIMIVIGCHVAFVLVYLTIAVLKP